MRFWHSIPLIFVLVVGLSAQGEETGETKEPSATARAPRFSAKNALQRIPTPAQRARFEADVANLSARYRQGMSIQGSFKIHWDDVQGVPVFITVPNAAQAPPTVQSASGIVQARNTALVWLQTNASLLRIKNPAAELREIEAKTDDLGFTHLRYQQMYQGVEVWARDVRVHLNPDGAVESFNGRYVPTPADRPPGTVEVATEQARKIASSWFGPRTKITDTRLVYLPDDVGGMTLCWLVGVAGRLDQRRDLFIETTTGRIVKEYNRVATDGPAVGSGTDVKGVTRSLNIYQIGSNYYMIDATKPMYDASQSHMPDDGRGAIYVLDARNYDDFDNLYYVMSTNPNSWSCSPGVTASFFFGKVYDYYKTVCARDCYDNAGATVNTIVNFDTRYANAFWTPSASVFVFGNGDGQECSDLTGSIDVIGHEFTHAVDEYSANLVYETQSGALNESFSDIFATLIEFWQEGTAGDWLIGEDVSIGGGAFRSMAEPGRYGQPSKMSEYKNRPNTEAGDWGGVHVNSGIPNRAFYLFATASGMTKEDAGKVYYRALSLYLNRNSQFVDCRLAVIKAAEDLFGGAGNARAQAAAAAFDAVEITSGGGTGDPPSDPAVKGPNYLALIATGTGKLLRWSIGSVSDFVQLSNVPISSRPTATDNGAMLFYVDTLHNVHAVRSDGARSFTLSTSGGFNNVSISRSGRYLAATSTYSMPSIYVFDLVDTTGDKVLHLYTPTSSKTDDPGSVRYPDRIDWTADETAIMYDAWNTMVLTGGDTIGFWNINTIRRADGAVFPLFPPQARGVDIGNPVFASNTDNLIAFDFCNASGHMWVYTVKVNTGDLGLVTDNSNSWGSPTFSVDDRKIYYHYYKSTNKTWTVWSVSLKPDGITGAGDDVVEIMNGCFPVAFAVGTRPGSDVPGTETLPSSFDLAQNYPNPFNPGTTIRYSLARRSHVTMTVFNTLGQQVSTLVQGVRNAGSHEVRFDGSGLPSGVYLYRLRTADFVQTKKLLLLK